MSNDGWGKLPTNNDGWQQTAHDEWVSADVAKLEQNPAAMEWSKSNSIPSWPKAAVSDGWGPIPAKVIANSAADMFECNGRQDLADPLRLVAEREEQWTHNALEGAQNRAAVINSINERKDEYTIDRDGELSNINETVRAKRQSDETGWYLCYKEKWLHAIISGPYKTPTEALLRADRAWSMFTEDAAFKLAFENKFNRDGLYCAEIPLSLNRKGAYGRLE